MHSLLSSILDWQNLQRAYAELVAQFDETNKSNTYVGIDGITLADLETNATALLAAVRQELTDNMPPDPVRSSAVPKTDGTLRPVYLFSLKDRLKAQAIHRVIEPLIETRLSPFLFSYRPTRSHHQAAKSVAKRHRAYHQEDTVARIDLQQYIDHLDHGILRDLLLQYGIDEPVADRILQFASTARCEDGILQYASKGSLAGNSLTPLLQNVYLNDVDLVAGRQVALYRRVGDDIVICDRDATKVEHVLQAVTDACSQRKLFCNSAKTVLSAPGEPFRFVGYEFNAGVPAIDPGAARRIRIRFSWQLPLDNVSTPEKVRALAGRWFLGEESLHSQFIDILKGYPYADDDRQMRSLSLQCIHVLVRHLFGRYTPRNHRRVSTLLQTYQLPTLYDYFRDLRYRHTGLGSLAASAPRRYQVALQAGAPAL